MPFEFIQIPANGQGSAKEELNRITGRVSHGDTDNTERSMLEISVSWCLCEKPPIKHLLFSAALLLVPLLAHADPSVSNVRAAQREGSNLVDIYYTLSGGTVQSVTVEISSDNGATYTVPASSLSGHVGSNVAAGSNRKITWNAGADWAGQFSAGMKVKVTASDIPPAPAGMALIPAGSFSMGDALDGSSTALPMHTVALSAFYMDKYEVTKKLWDDVADWATANGYDITAAGGSGKSVNHPVYSVTWFECIKWCNARSEKEGLNPCYSAGGVICKTGSALLPDCDLSASGYRLPTEAEWEKAARGGLSGKRFPWGDSISHAQANYFSDSSYSYDVSPTLGYHPDWDDTAPYTSPVGTFSPNGYGIYDIAGNLWEWVNDMYSSSYYSISPGSDPVGPAPVFPYYRVWRGGGWDRVAGSCSVSVRTRDLSKNSYNNLGFRCARSSVP
jgi:formylglycine-generating enzyme